MKEYVGIGNKIKYHFHITTLHKYIQCIARVKAKHKEVILMYSCYVEVVFNFAAKVKSLSCDLLLYFDKLS